MNSEHYADPTADEAIGNVMQEWRRKTKYGKKRICTNDTGREVVLGENRSAEKQRNKTQKERNEGNT